MPALPSVPGVVRIQYQFHLGEDLVAKCRTYQGYSGGLPSAAALNTMATSLRTAFSSDCASLLSSDYSLTEIVVTDLSSSTGAIGTETTTLAGSLTGSNLPASACVLHSRTVARRFRGGHSRIYWPFGNATELQDPQTWLASFVAAVTTGLSGLGAAELAAVNVWGTGTGPVSVSYYSGFTTHTGTTGRVRNVATVRATPVVDPVISAVVHVPVASQRRRLLKA